MRAHSSKPLFSLLNDKAHERKWKKNSTRGTSLVSCPCVQSNRSWRPSPSNARKGEHLLQTPCLPEWPKPSMWLSFPIVFSPLNALQLDYDCLLPRIKREVLLAVFPVAVTEKGSECRLPWGWGSTPWVSSPLPLA